MRPLTVALLAAAVVPSAMIAQVPSGFPGRAILVSDSAYLGDPIVSPDGRWLVFMRPISNQESRFMIRAMAGGESRELSLPKAAYSAPRFTPQGDRLVFASTLPRRSSDEVLTFLVSAPFDTRTGMITASPRQISLDGVRLNPRFQYVISPDGQWVVYIASNNALRVLPIEGGNARTIADPTGNRALTPGWLSWSADSRFVTYHVREGDESIFRRVSRDGGKATDVSRMNSGMGVMTPDGRHFVTIDNVRGRATLIVHGKDGRTLAEVPTPMLRWLSFSPDGKHLYGVANNTKATIKLVPVSGGPIRPIGRGESYEWAEGWSDDAQTLHISMIDAGTRYLQLIGIDGRVQGRVATSEMGDVVGIQEGHIVSRDGLAARATGWTLVATRMSDGRRTVLATDIVGRACCGDPVGAGGNYYGIHGKEFYYRQIRGDRLQIRAMRVGGESRVIAEVPKTVLGKTGFAIFENRVAYEETVGDSTRLKVVTGVGRAPRTIASFPSSISIGEFYWSHDGRQLSLYSSTNPRRLVVYGFDDSGAVKGPPREFTLPFEYFYETFWLPDGSGMTMIAQPLGAPTAEVALVKFSDAGNPIYLAKSDSASKWGHALSPDGKYVAYPSEKAYGSTIYQIELAELLKRAMAKR